jgi:hypothetical protein
MYQNKIKSLFSIMVALLLLIFVSSCSNGSSHSWQIVFEDDFDGDSLDTDQWYEIHSLNIDGCLLMESDPAPFSLTGAGELRIDGRSGGGQDGAVFLSRQSYSYDNVKISTKLRSTLNDPVEDDAELVVLLNFDSTSFSGYLFLLQSDPDGGGSRDYAMQIYKIVDCSSAMLLEEESISGDTPQIEGDRDYILELINLEGSFTFTIYDGNSNKISSISANDPTYENGSIGFGSDLNIKSAESNQSVYFDYIQIYEQK